MSAEITPSPLLPALLGPFPVPAIIADAGKKVSEHFLEFFAATIRNPNTGTAYVQASAQFFRWCEKYQLQLKTIRPLHVSAYIESKPLTAPSIKQHLAALRGLFNWLVIKQAVPDNPTLIVKGPKFSRQVGVTPILEPGQMRMLLNSIPITREVKIPKNHGGGVKVVADVKGLRDRAIIAIMAYTFARVSAVLKLKRQDYALQGKRARLRLLEKGNKEKLVWLHHEAEQYLDAYLEMANVSDADAPVFQTLDKNNRLSGLPIIRRDMLRIVKERCAAAGLPESICNHTFRGTGMTVFLMNGGSLEAAQEMANHSDPRTTKLYDRRKDLATLGEIERRIAFE